MGLCWPTTFQYENVGEAGQIPPSSDGSVPGLVPGIHVFKLSGPKDADGRALGRHRLSSTGDARPQQKL
jgi:hypothetical protein